MDALRQATRESPWRRILRLEAFPVGHTDLNRETTDTVTAALSVVVPLADSDHRRPAPAVPAAARGTSRASRAPSSQRSRRPCRPSAAKGGGVPC